MVEKVKRLHDDFQLSMLANLEELQHTQSKLHLTCCNEGVTGPKPRERGDDGNSPLWLASKPVRGLIGLPLPIVKIGAA